MNIYHEGSANLVADALSRKEHDEPKRVRTLILELKVDLLTKIKEAQKLALEEGNIKAVKENSTIDQLVNGDDEKLRLGKKNLGSNGRKFMRKDIGEIPFVKVYYASRKSHKSKYIMHPGSDKMYHNLKDDYWWIGMKKKLSYVLLNV